MEDTAERVLRARRFVAEIWPDRAYVNRRAHSIWTSIGSSHPEFQATCCLFQLGDDIAVITAAHAMIREDGRQFILGKGGRLFNVLGEGRWAAANESAQKGDDSLDLQVVLLDRAVSDQMPREGLLTATDVAFQDEEERDAAFLLSGFPASRQRVIPSVKRTEADLHSLILSSPVVRNKHTESHHIELEYDQRRLYRDGQRITSVAPRGMSGAGVWRLSRSRILGDIRRLQLAGILVERRKGNRPALLATRISYALRLLLGIDAKFSRYLPPWVKSPL